MDEKMRKLIREADSILIELRTRAGYGEWLCVMNDAIELREVGAKIRDLAQERDS